MAEAHLPTERLRLRVLRPRDREAFGAYRDDPDVARYQGWDLPFTLADADELIDQMAGLDGPTPGCWVQLAIADPESDELLGDLAVFLDVTGQFAKIGYTIAKPHQGKGYATEAAGAMVDWLFRHTDTHRIGLELDPRNGSSARVAEALGFEYVGTTTGSALVRGSWEDDTRFSITADQRAAWLSRPTGRPVTVELHPVTHDNVLDVLGLEIGFSQRELVGPTAKSLAEIVAPPLDDGHPIEPWYRAVVADGEVVGFALMVTPHPHRPYPYLWRFLIDRAHQRRGLGSIVVELLVDHWRQRGYDRLHLTFNPEVPGNPGPFYRRLGCTPTGNIIEGETELELRF